MYTNKKLSSQIFVARVFLFYGAQNETYIED